MSSLHTFLDTTEEKSTKVAGIGSSISKEATPLPTRLSRTE